MDNLKYLLTLENMGTLLKSEVFQGRKVVNKNELTSGVNDGNVIKLESRKRGNDISEKNSEIELFSSKIRNLINEIISEVTEKWHEKNRLFKYFTKDSLNDITNSIDILNDKMLISGLLMNEGLSNTESKTYIPFSDEEKLGHIKEFIISQFKDKIEKILDENSSYRALIFTPFT